jgi:SAM-dependent methyltransferase
MVPPTLGQLLLGTEGLGPLALGRYRRRRRPGGSCRRDPLPGRPLRRRAGLAAGHAQVRPGGGNRLWSATYDASLRQFPVEGPTVRAILDTLLPGRLLDAASGTGRHSEWLAGRSHAVVGVDASPDMLAEARAKLPQARFEQGDLAALPLPDASVDAALCALAFVHLPDLSPAMAELARVARPGGRVVVSDVHPFLVALGWQAQFRSAAGGTGLIRLHRHLPSSYAQAAAVAGLAVANLFEPALPAASAVTVAQGPIPGANAAAWAGLPGVIVWDFVKPRAP